MFGKGKVGEMIFEQGSFCGYVNWSGGRVLGVE